MDGKHNDARSDREVKENEAFIKRWNEATCPIAPVAQAQPCCTRYPPAPRYETYAAEPSNNWACCCACRRTVKRNGICGSGPTSRV